ncbi:MAG: stage III sporulation protein AB [Clostridiales bacterium]|nr:stage III sporulation protein AB [Clostridiales bacterium]
MPYDEGGVDMERLEAVRTAVSVLPSGLRRVLLARQPGEQSGWEEIRLRAGRGLSCTDGTGRERPVLEQGRPVPITREHLRQTVELATHASLQGLEGKLAAGFLPLEGGHRLGLCGTASLRDGRICAFRSLSSVNLRIACPAPGIGAPLLPQLMEGGHFYSTLILAPPGEGKTTLLRDLIRLLGCAGIRVGLADERGEVAALRDGVPQLDVGPLADVADGCAKGDGLLLLLRSMSPQVLAVDEITHPADAEALCQGANCGAAVLATAHGSGREELERRSALAPLLEQRVFRYLLTIRRQDGVRQYRVEPMPCSG